MPEVKEVRSVSKYGISLVSIIFKEKTDIMYARQLVSEKMTGLSIPEEYGTPEMGPISTGLGEVIQFTLESEKHSLMELTTQMNWFINPILKTVPGVVEVNTFGGNVKEYQIILNIDKMNSLKVSTMDVIEAIKSNNISAGGGYIEKNKEHQIITLEGLLKDLKDLEQIFVGEVEDGTPIYLSSISQIKIGSKLKRGSATKDGRGEVVGGIVLMLLGENSLETSTRIKEKLEDIRQFLPEGMKIELFYDRSVLVNETIWTVVKNLSEGAFLVIFILFLMLGNIRAGFIIASVIPLCMLFTFVIMNFRDAPVNLMSMGAIDFGLLVDGAVIVIENTVRRVSEKVKSLGRSLSKEEKIQTIKDATIEVRRATIFGEMILIIVYIPILMLSGVEGKIFIPMAVTVLYALIGAFIFTLTFVPVLASFLIKAEENTEHKTVIFSKIENVYSKLLDKTLSRRVYVVGCGILFFIFSLFMFNRLGAEFIPRLDEGSILLELGRLPSTSLKESVNSSLKIEKALKEQIPEIHSVVSKIGSPDLAVEPLGLQQSESFIQMVPKDDWTMSKEEIIAKIQKITSTTYPAAQVSLSQPIEMRINEMSEGIKSDVGIIIFGNDLKKIKEIATSVSTLASSIRGVEDLRIEQVDGISYIRVVPNREKLARYGVHVEDISKVISMISAGEQVGEIYEGDRKFAIRIKLFDSFKDREVIQTLPVKASNGDLIPLGDLVDIFYEQGPARITHEAAQRRITVEFNIRDRDLVGAVYEIQDKIQTEIDFPQGYRFDVGGAYKNYVSAREKFFWLIPLTLIMILFVLWLAFKEITPSLVIFLNVPFAITGGILALSFRDMPFSISAGIGFIALFGVAILNGLVLISFAKSLENLGKTNLEIIREAAFARLRPVVTTAIVASLGFIPMALSTSPGSEVQRPLATVVIGGLITSTFLTLFVLPAIYSYLPSKKNT